MTILITCATAKTSRRLVELLRADHDLLLASRSGQSLGGIPAVCFDWDAAEKWPDIFDHDQARKDSIHTVYLVPRSNTVDPAATAVPFIALCQQRGVRRMVLLGGSALEDVDCTFSSISAELKRLQHADGSQWALLRPSWFMENFTEEEHMLTIREKSTIYSAAGSGKLPFVAVEDIVRVAAHMLTVRDAPNCDYLIVGPDLLSYSEVAAILAELLGRKVEHVQLTTEALTEHYYGQGIPKEYAEFLASLDQRVAEGKEAYANNIIERVTGRKPIQFRDFARDNIQVWNEL